MVPKVLSIHIWVVPEEFFRTCPSSLLINKDPLFPSQARLFIGSSKEMCVSRLFDFHSLAAGARGSIQGSTGFSEL
jgi:hypothetical protein